MTWGTITTLRHDRGYGFIAPDDRGHHLFFHRGAVAGGGFGGLRAGQRVLVVGGVDPLAPRRTRAVRVRPVGG